jgi:hypothetical protein
MAMTVAHLRTTPGAVDFESGDETGYSVEVNLSRGDTEVCISVHGGGEGDAWITPADARRMAHALTLAAQTAEENAS